MNNAGNRNINIRAAFICAIDDRIWSLDVLLATFIIKFRPTWYFADPVCTFVFLSLVIIPTLAVMRDAKLVLMEGEGRHTNYEAVLQERNVVDSVKLAHSLHIWSLTMSKTAIAAHFALDMHANVQEVLDRASTLLQSRHGIHHTTLQVENEQERDGKLFSLPKETQGIPTQTPGTINNK